MRKPLARRPRRKIRWTRVFLVLLIFVVLLGGAVHAAYQAFNRFLDSPVTASANSGQAVVPAAVPRTEDSSRINILLMGIDDGDLDVEDSPSRSDAILLASIDLAQKKVHLVSIPRDTRVSIPGHKGLDKINNAYFYGGPVLALRTVEEFLHVPVPYYMTVKWQGFIQVIDILGGVDLYVEHDMDYEDPYANLQISLHKGYQHLNGHKAGEYVRFRHDELGDIGRVERQQKFMKALSEQFWQASTILKIPAIVAAIHQNIQLNTSVYTSIQVANVVRSLKPGQFVAEMLPGNFATIQDISYWEPDRPQVKLLVERIFAPPAVAATSK